MIENLENNLKKEVKLGLSKAFETMDHSVLIAKLEAYGFDNLSLESMKNYLTNRKEICKVGLYGEKLHQVYLKVPYLDPCFLTSS